MHITAITKALILALLAVLLAASAAPAAQREDGVIYEHRTTGDALMAATTVMGTSRAAEPEVENLTPWEVEEALGWEFTVESRYWMTRSDLRALNATAGQAFALSA